MFWTNISKLCYINGISPTELCKRLDLSNATAVRWKAGAVPRNSTVKKIADYFGVVPESLFAETPLPLSGQKEKAAPAGNGSSEATSVFQTLPLEKRGTLPIYGTVSAGRGILAEEDIIGYETADAKHCTEDYFYLKVQGSSMSPRIEDGDLVLVHKQTSVDSGRIGVFLVDDTDGFVKKVEYDEENIYLISYNSIYPPMHFKGTDVLRVRVLGLVVELKRKL